MRCDLCGGTDGVETYGIYPSNYTPTFEGSRITSEKHEWLIQPSALQTRNYCDACVSASRRKSVRHAALVFFLPTPGLMRLFKFGSCSKQEMGDLMAASEIVQRRDPRTKHIIWPYGSSAGNGVPSMEHHLTREKAEKRLQKRQGS